MMEMGINEARKQMQSQNNLSEEQIDQALEITRKFFVPIVIGSILLMFALIGAIASLCWRWYSKEKSKRSFCTTINLKCFHGSVHCNTSFQRRRIAA